MTCVVAFDFRSAMAGSTLGDVLLAMAPAPNNPGHARSNHAGANRTAEDAAGGLADMTAGDIQASRNGDADAYARLIKRYQPQVAARMWKFTRDRTEYEELVHEVFVELYFSLGRYREMDSFAGWLNRIASRVGYRFWKRQKRVSGTVSLDGGVGAGMVAPDSLSPDQSADRLHGLLGQLRPRDRLVLTLLYWDGYSIAETARQTGWSQAMVKVQAHRARGRLRRLLEKT